MEVMHERNAHNFLLDLVATATTTATPVVLTALLFWLSFVSGLAKPLVALLGYVLLWSVVTPLVMGVVFASVGGEDDRRRDRRHGCDEHEPSVSGLT